MTTGIRKSPTTGTLTAKIDGEPALEADLVHVNYANNTMEIYGQDTTGASRLTSVTLKLVRDIKTGVYVFPDDKDFQGAEVRYNGLPYLYDTKSATLNITTNHQNKHSYGKSTISAVATFDPDDHIVVFVEFDLHGGTGIP